jgi:hypothetical protein
MQKAIFKEGSMWPVPVPHNPKQSTKIWEAYFKTLLPVPSEHHSHFKEGEEYEEGVHFNTIQQFNYGYTSGIADWGEVPPGLFGAGKEAFRTVAIPIIREEVEEKRVSVARELVMDYLAMLYLDAQGCYDNEGELITGKQPKIVSALENASKVINQRQYFLLEKIISKRLQPLTPKTPSTETKH